MMLTKTQTFFALYALSLIVQLTAIDPVDGSEAVGHQIVAGFGGAIATMIPAFHFVVGTRNWTNRSWIGPALPTVSWAALIYVGSR